MLDRFIRERLAGPRGRARLVRRVLKTTGRPESQIEELVHPIYSRWTEAAMPIETTILAVPGQIELHLSVRAEDADQARVALDAATAEIATALGPTLFAVGDHRLEEVVGTMLRERGLRIATAESCTGGLLASRLTDVPGSSDYVERGVVCYSNRAKTDLLGVPEALIREHGAVSEPVGLEMARAIRERAGAELLERDREVYVGFSGDEVGHPAVAKECEIFIGHTVGEYGDDVIAVDVVLIPRQSAAWIDRDRE